MEKRVRAEMRGCLLSDGRNQGARKKGRKFGVSVCL